MKFEPAKLSKIIEHNFSYLMPDFYEMQTEYMKSMIDMYKINKHQYNHCLLPILYIRKE